MILLGSILVWAGVAIGLLVVAAIVIAVLPGVTIYRAIGAANDLEANDPDESPVRLGPRYSRRRRQRARSKGALAAERGWSPSMCPYTSQDEPLRQEWLTGHLLVRLRRLPPPELGPRPVVREAGNGIIFLNGGDPAGRRSAGLS